MAPGFQLHSKTRPIAKGLTSKTDELLSKMSYSFSPDLELLNLYLARATKIAELAKAERLSNL